MRAISPRCKKSMCWMRRKTGAALPHCKQYSDISQPKQHAPYSRRPQTRAAATAARFARAIHPSQSCITLSYPKSRTVTCVAAKRRAFCLRPTPHSRACAGGTSASAAPRGVPLRSAAALLRVRPAWRAALPQKGAPASRALLACTALLQFSTQATRALLADRQHSPFDPKPPPLH